MNTKCPICQMMADPPPRDGTELIQAFFGFNCGIGAALSDPSDDRVYIKLCRRHGDMAVACTNACVPGVPADLVTQQ